MSLHYKQRLPRGKPRGGQGQPRRSDQGLVGTWGSCYQRSIISWWEVYAAGVLAGWERGAPRTWRSALRLSASGGMGTLPAPHLCSYCAGLC